MILLHVIHMLKYLTISRILTIAALFAPLILAKSLFFPFITGKAIFFRVVVELALLCFILYLFLPRKNEKAPDLLSILRPLRHPVSIFLTAFAIISLITAFTALNTELALWSNFE